MTAPQELPRDIFDNVPEKVHARLLEIYGRIEQDDAALRAFCLLRMESYMLSEIPDFTADERALYTQRSEENMKVLRTLLGDKDLEFLLRGLAFDVDPR